MCVRIHVFFAKEKRERETLHRSPPSQHPKKNTQKPKPFSSLSPKISLFSFCTSLFPPRSLHLIINYARTSHALHGRQRRIRRKWLPPSHHPRGSYRLKVLRPPLHVCALAHVRDVVKVEMSKSWRRILRAKKLPPLLPLRRRERNSSSNNNTHRKEKW